MKLCQFVAVVALAALVSPMWRSASAQDASAPETTTIYIVRHAEKVAGEYPGNDHPLTDKGRARARALASMLRSVDLAAVYSTKWQRTRDTVTPSAALHELEITEYAGGYESDDIVSPVLQQHRGRCVLIGGHFDNVPLIMQDFGADPGFELTKDDYDGLYVVTVVHLADGCHTAGFQRLHFEPWETSQSE